LQEKKKQGGAMEERSAVAEEYEWSMRESDKTRRLLQQAERNKEEKTKLVSDLKNNLEKVAEELKVFM